MNISKVPTPIIIDIAMNMGWDEKEETFPRYVNRMRDMSAAYLFERYCEWHGLLGWGNQLWDVMHQLKDAQRNG